MESSDGRAFCLQVLRAGEYYALQRWLAVTRMNKEMKRKSRRLLQALTDSKIFFTFTCWKAGSKECARLKSVVKKVLGRMLQRCLTIMFDKWAQVSTEKRVMERKTRKVLQYLKNAQLVVALNTWRQCWEEAKRLRAAGKKIVFRMLNAALAVAFASWAQTAASQARVRRRVSAMIWNSGASNALRLWREYTKEQITVRGKTRKVLFRLTHDHLVRSFYTWSEMALATRKSNAIMARILARMQNACSALAFGMWVAAIDERKRQSSVMQRAVMRIKLLAVLGCWNKWYDAVLHRRSVLSRASKVFGIMLNDICRVHFAAWSDMVFSLEKEEEEEKQEQEEGLFKEEEPLPQVSQILAQALEETSRPMASVNTVRIAKGFFQWANNLWWSRELKMQHERFVLLLQVLSLYLTVGRNLRIWSSAAHSFAPESASFTIACFPSCLADLRF